ncbi:MAG: hypothetical protein APR54_02750 [Candidatus Cloacimonas sp. SDB]|nr:MAG: hypothetical protein APR54_02750 [Candidatus Cloacimonas sp. SDB]
MKKKNLYLEKRIFLLFFLLSFIIVLILILIEWQLAVYGIKQAENKEILEINSKFSSHLRQLYKDREILFNSILEDPEFRTLLTSNEPGLLRDKIRQFNLPENIFFYIYDQDRQMSLGENWEFLDNQINSIYDSPASQYAVSSYGNKMYLLCTKKISYNSTFYGIFITMENLQLSGFPMLTVEGSHYLASYPLEESFLAFDDLLHNRVPQINKILAEIIAENKSDTIVRISSSQAIGFRICPYFSEPAAVFAVYLPRYIYNFAQQSVLLFVLILIAVTIILIIILGNWFSRTILFPIRTISSRMNEISLNPARLEPLKKNYRGVLGEMLNTFNIMNRSLHKYSENLKEYKLISDNLDSGFFWLDDNLRITLCNNSLFNILDIFSSEQLIGKNINDFLKLNDNHLANLKLEGLTLHEWEIKTQKQRKYLLIKIMPVFKQDHRIYVGNITDITSRVEERTSRQALELELIKSNRMAEIGRRIEGIIHNINSPLNTVLGYAQLMKKNLPENEDLEKIIQGGKSISHIVKGVLNKSKLDSSSMIRSININDLILQELDLCNHNLFFKHYVDLKIDLEKDLPEINAVYGDISLCLANILNNAIDALEKSPEKVIRVKTFTENNQLNIQVKDSGEGIKTKNTNVIFEPYFTTKTKPEDKGSGFGLGLAISKNIVSRYGGKITVESVPDIGSTFTISLPVNEENPK